MRGPGDRFLVRIDARWTWRPAEMDLVVILGVVGMIPVDRNRRGCRLKTRKKGVQMSRTSCCCPTRLVSRHRDVLGHVSKESNNQRPLSSMTVARVQLRVYAVEGSSVLEARDVLTPTLVWPSSTLPPRERWQIYSSVAQESVHQPMKVLWTKTKRKMRGRRVHSGERLRR